LNKKNVIANAAEKLGEPQLQDDLRPEYDFALQSGGIRGKYYEQYCKGMSSRSFESAPDRPQQMRSRKAYGRSAEEDKL